MRKIVALALALFSVPAVGQTDSPWLDWVAENSPHGFDITPGGDIWINMAAPGERNDYAVSADDLKAARDASSKRPEFWVRGYHKRNPDVKYRTSMSRIRLDCATEMLTVLTTVFTDANGEPAGRSGYSPAQYVVPGTYGAAYHRLFCID